VQQTTAQVKQLNANFLIFNQIVFNIQYISNRIGENLHLSRMVV
jgi:hypothetical protein